MAQNRPAWDRAPSVLVGATDPSEFVNTHVARRRPTFEARQLGTWPLLASSGVMQRLDLNT